MSRILAVSGMILVILIISGNMIMAGCFHEKCCKPVSVECCVPPAPVVTCKVPVTEYKDVVCKVKKPVWTDVQRQVTTTVCVPQQEERTCQYIECVPKMEQHRITYKVCIPVVETVQKEITCTVCVPQTEQIVRTVCVPTWEEVDTEVCITPRTSCYYKKHCARRCCKPCVPACSPCAPACAPEEDTACDPVCTQPQKCVVKKRVCVMKPIQQICTVTRMVPQQKTQLVSQQVCTMKEELRTKYVTVKKMVPETRTKTYVVTKMVPQQRTWTVTEKVCSWEDAEVIRKVPVTTWVEQTCQQSVCCMPCRKPCYVKLCAAKLTRKCVPLCEPAVVTHVEEGTLISSPTPAPAPAPAEPVKSVVEPTSVLKDTADTQTHTPEKATTPAPAPAPAPAE